MTILSWRFSILAAFIASSTAALGADEQTTLARTVTGTSIVSDHDPAIRISLPPGAVYVGAVRWPLYKVADAELHAFVEADASGLVRRFYWIQFESLLPSAKGNYNYSDSNTTTGRLAATR